MKPKNSHFQCGRIHGLQHREAIEHNLSTFWSILDGNGYRRRVVCEKAREDRHLLREERLEEIRGVARGSGLPFQELLAYNLFRGLVLADECTVMIVLGSASASGNTLFLKNSDKVGGESLVGPQFFQHKEVNVILNLRLDSGIRIVGVSAAGSMGVKMGINSKGVAVGSNIARTQQLKDKKVDLTTIRAIDRAELGREALEMGSALEATQLVVSKILKDPMGTPGNMEFVDAREAYIVEGSYDRYAVEKVTEGIAARSNCFILLKELNQWDDLSSQARYIRSLQLLRQHQGRLTPELLKSFSMDHENGPGPNSICRHGRDFREETSLAAAVMEIDGKDPLRSRVEIALGKPCHAWRETSAHWSLSLGSEADVPQEFEKGDVWKRFYTEEPRYA